MQHVGENAPRNIVYMMINRFNLGNTYSLVRISEYEDFMVLGFNLVQVAVYGCVALKTTTDDDDVEVS